jgi:signal peptidase II
MLRRKYELVQKNIIFIILFILIFFIDQWIKWQILDGFRWDSECLSVTFVLNRGVAFSMFAFLDEYLKYLQIVFIAGVVVFMIYEKLFFLYFIPFSILLAAASSNVLDRFIHQGVVDYIYYHCGFDFAIFNFADVMIDFSVVIILWIYYKNGKTSNVNLR